MKKILSLFLSVIICTTSILCIPFYSGAQETKYETIYVSNGNSDSVAQNVYYACMNAKELATPEKPYKIVVEPGTYKLSRNILVYSNTTLDLTGVTLVKNFDVGTIIRIGHVDDEAVGYDYYKNISIIGGTLDSNGLQNTKSSGCAINVDHAQNISITGTNFTNSRDSHQLSFAGCKDVVVKNCNFSNVFKTSPSVSSVEALQLDILEKSHYDYKPNVSYDYTMNQNITIDNCTFTNVDRGVGSHSCFIGAYMKNINITNCKFNNVHGFAISAVGTLNCKIQNNSIKNAGAGIIYKTVNNNFSNCYLYKNLITKNTSTIISGNTITTVKPKDTKFTNLPYGIKIYGVKLNANKKLASGIVKAGDYRVYGVSVSKNTITMGYQGNGVWLLGTYGAKVSSNKVSYKAYSGASQPSYCYRAENSEKSSITSNNGNGNNVSYTYHGIALVDAPSTTVSSNTITKQKKCGIFLDLKTTSAAVKSNTVSYCAEQGIYARDGAKITTSANSIKYCTQDGILLKQTNSASTLSGDKIESCKKHGVEIYKAKAKLTSVSSKKNNNYGFYITQSSTATMVKPTASTNKKDGIYVNQSAKATIDGGSSSSNTLNGVYFTTKASGSIKNMSVSSNKKYGIFITKSAKKVAVNKIKYSKNKGGKIIK